MRDAFKQIFWGFLLVWIDIHLFIDILADPFGYYLILSGLKLLQLHIPISSKAKNVALLLIFVSIPSVIIEQNTGTIQMGQIPFLSGWPLYFIILGLLKIILVFYIFQVILAIVQKYGEKELIKRSSKTFTVYMSIMLLISFIQSFSINFSTEQFNWVVILMIIIGFITEIAFLMLLNTVGKLKINKVA